MIDKIFLTLADCQERADKVADAIADAYHMSVNYPRIYGVPRGGLMPAMMVAQALREHHNYAPRVVDNINEAQFIIDDVIDSGSTYRQFGKTAPGVPFFGLYDKYQGEDEGWLVFPWEVGLDGDENSAEDIVIRLLEYIGEDPDREGLQETPKRFLKAWKEWTSGYGQDPKAILKQFEDGAEKVDEMVIVHNIPVISKCEHHLADIIGIAHIGYIPNGKIVGLSKIPRLLDIFQRRLQVQERLTNQVAETLFKELEPKGVGVIIRASHACMSSRGVKIHGSVTTTSAMRGVLLEKPEARQEFLALCRDAEK